VPGRWLRVRAVDLVSKRRVDPVNATPEDGISDAQASGLAELLDGLDRSYPPGGIKRLSFNEAADLISKLRAELLSIQGKASQ
jgi:hypothetical protein